MTTKLRMVSVSVLVACAALFLASRNRAEAQASAPGKSYRMVSLETVRNGDEIRPLELRTRLVKATGEWKEEVVSLRKGFEGRKRVVYNTPEGQYVQNTQSRDSLQLADGFAQAATRSAELLKASPEFVRTDSLLGFTTYVLRSGWIESHFAPEVGGIPIKVVMHDAKGDQVIEAIQIEFVPVSDADLAKPDLPVKLDFLTNKIEQAESQGNRGLADSLRKVMQSQRY